MVAEGTFSIGSGDFDYDTNDADGSRFGVFLREFGTGERVDQKNYHITYKTQTGTQSCGSGCTPVRMEYDEHCRMDARRSDGTKSNLFHRTHIVLHKTGSGSDNLLA